MNGKIPEDPYPDIVESKPTDPRQYPEYDNDEEEEIDLKKIPTGTWVTEKEYEKRKEIWENFLKSKSGGKRKKRRTKKKKGGKSPKRKKRTKKRRRRRTKKRRRRRTKKRR